jgi:hypothetical protein
MISQRLASVGFISHGDSQDQHASDRIKEGALNHIVMSSNANLLSHPDKEIIP